MLRHRYIRSTAAFLLACVLIVPACTRKETKPALPGNPAPSFSLKDIEGNTIRLEDHAGKVIVIDFWATWCGPCKDATRELEDIHRKFGNRSVVVIGISVDTGGGAAAQVKEFAARQKITYLLLLDDGNAKKAYGVTVVPATYILDRGHIIRDLYPGFRPGIGSEIERTIEKLL
jgi:peroxiredoxin